jgi:hypothetical protein
MLLPRMNWFLHWTTADGQTLNAAQEHSICSSTLGVIARAMYAPAQAACNQADGYYTFFMVLGVAGVILLAAAAWSQYRHLHPAAPATPPPPGPRGPTQPTLPYQA